MKPRAFIHCFAWILFCEGIGLLSSVFTIQAIPTWYVFLQKPLLSPPNWLFAPVWTTLYAFMGISLFLIMQKKKSAMRTWLIELFFVQLALNAVWSMFFFGFRQLDWAFLDILFLLGTLVLYTKDAFTFSKISAWLFVPYIAWVSFAMYLNLMTWVLN